jgi:processive 1,2-diacylglycerol beta-glucosyltransferase
MIITQIVPGQEEGNAQLVVENGCGALALTPDAVSDTVEQLTQENGLLWKKWAAQTAQIGRPDSARTVARYVLENSKP